MKVINIILKVLLCLIIVTPILGALGIFPPPTPDLYNTPEAFAFINMLYASGFMIYLIALVYAISLVMIVMGQMAIAALLILPSTVVIFAFHLLLDGGLLTAGAVMSNALALLNAYFLWQHRKVYKGLWRPKTAPAA